MNRPTRHHARGLTLIEVLAALILLSLIMGALSSWLMTVARGSHELTQRTQFRAAAKALFQRIAEDLTTGDVDPRQPELAEPTINGDTLTIPTRSLAIDHRGEPVRRTYTFDSSDQSITVHESPSEHDAPHQLLGDVQAMSMSWVVIDRDRPTSGRLLTVTVLSIDGEQFKRRWVVR